MFENKLVYRRRDLFYSNVFSWIVLRLGHDNIELLNIIHPCIRKCNHIFMYVNCSKGVHVAKWAKRPPLKQDVPGFNPRGWLNGRAGNRDP